MGQDEEGSQHEARAETALTFASMRGYRLHRGREASAARSSESRLRTRRHRVLIIEDNVDMADTLREMLERHNHDVTVAFDGVEGLELARKLIPRVILCDIGLPGMSGYEVCRALRGDHAFRTTYLVALTGYAEPDDLRRVHAAGFDRHVVKPFNPDVIVRTVSHALLPLARAGLRAAPSGSVKLRRSR